MSEHNNPISILDSLNGEELSSVTFVRDYLQLHFDGPFINIFNWPTLKMLDKEYKRRSPQYKDLLCDQIGRIVIKTTVIDDDCIIIAFENMVSIVISLREEDKIKGEAAMFQNFQTAESEVW